MVILKYELKRHRTYILGWAIALALCIFLMTPTYYSFLDAASVELFETMGTTDFYRSVGVSMEYLTSPLGIYGFLTSFFMIASGIFGMHFGISIHTRECTEGTSEYLFTKPFPRKAIYWAKALTVFVGVAIVGAAYLLASLFAMAIFRSGTPWGEFFLIALSLTLVTLFFAAMGLMVGVLFSRNRSPLLTAGLVVFVEYCISCRSVQKFHDGEAFFERAGNRRTYHAGAPGRWRTEQDLCADSERGRRCFLLSSLESSQRC